MKNKTALITGANGFIGSHLVDFCVKQNMSVKALVRPKSSLVNLSHYTEGKKDFSPKEMNNLGEAQVLIPSTKNNLQIVECNIKNANLLETLLKAILPDYISTSQPNRL